MENKNKCESDSLSSDDKSNISLDSGGAPEQTVRSFITHSNKVGSFDLSKGGLVFSAIEPETVPNSSSSDVLISSDSPSIETVENPKRKKYKRVKHSFKNHKKKTHSQINEDLFICSEQRHYSQHFIPNILNPDSFKGFSSSNHSIAQSCFKASQEYGSLEKYPEELPDSELLQNLHQFSQAFFTTTSLGRTNMEKFPLSSLISLGVLAEELVKHELVKLPFRRSILSSDFEATKLCQPPQTPEAIIESFQLLGKTVHSELDCFDSVPSENLVKEPPID